MSLASSRSALNCKRLVIKIGTSSLTDSHGGLDEERLAQFTKNLAQLVKDFGKEVLLVTSGAIGAGVDALGLKRRPKDLPHLQMAAAIGQSRLMSSYTKHFAEQGLLCAQVLLTHDDLKNRSRHINAVNAFDSLLRNKVIPVINENDVVSIDEIKVGDNDTLAAMVAIMVKADLLVLMTTSDGLRTAPGSVGERIPYLDSVSKSVLALAQGKTNQFSTGGMQTKLLACRMAQKVGIPSLIIDSREPRNIAKALDGADVGTLIAAAAPIRKLKSKLRHTGFFRDAKGVLVLDQGAAAILRKKTTSLLAVGIVKVRGHFSAGAVVELQTVDGEELGRGTTPFSSTQLRRIRGKRSSDIKSLLPKLSNKPVIHKDDLVIL